MAQEQQPTYSEAAIPLPAHTAARGEAFIAHTSLKL